MGGGRTMSVAFDETRPFDGEISRTIQLCRAAGSPFVDFLNKSEMHALEWASVRDTLRPSGRDPWRVFPAAGARAQDIEQGELGDCWFLSVVSVIAHRNPQLIERLFLVRDVNPEGVFALRLWCDGVWTPFLIDANFPAVNRGRTLKYGRCKNGDALWVPLLEKAYAKMHGSYESINAGRCEEAFYDLTGKPCTTLPLNGEALAKRQADGDDEPFVRMLSFDGSACIMAASCGVAERKDEATARGLRNGHAYSVLQVVVCVATRRRLVKLRNPWGHSKFKGTQPPAAGSTNADDRDTQQRNTDQGGIFWMDWHDFSAYFSEVTVCVTRPFVVELSSAPRCSAASSYLPAAPQQPRGALVFRVGRATALHVLAVQKSVRHASNDRYFDAMLLLVRVDGAGGPRVVCASPSLCSRVVFLEHMADPGAYCVLPLSVQQGLMPREQSQLVVNVMSESAEVTALPWAGTVPPLRVNELIFGMVQSHPQADRSHRDQLDWYSLHTGTISFGVIHNSGSSCISATHDPSGSDNLLHVPNNELGGMTDVALRPGQRAVVSMSVIKPHDAAGYSCAWKSRQQFAMTTGGLEHLPPTTTGGRGRELQIFQPF
jgi:hypothetical protein